MINYPISIPAISGVTSLTWSLETKCAISESPFTYQQVIFPRNAARWQCVVSLPIMTDQAVASWRGFLISLRGQYGTVSFGDLFRESPIGSALGAPRIKGASQTGVVLLTDGWASNQTGVLLAGDWIQIGQRLYQICKDTNSDGSGNATLDIMPAIIYPFADNTAIITQSSKGIFRLASANIELDSRSYRGFAQPVGFTLVEAI